MTPPRDQIEADLLAECKRLSCALRQAKAALEEHRVSLAQFKVGEVVEARLSGSNAAWEPAIIRRVQIQSWSGAAWYAVSFKKKNGEWSLVPLSVFSRVRAAL